jgi:hypothetical protein
MKGTPYIEIRTSDDKIWRRNSTATKWVQLGGSGTGIDSTAHYTITQQSDSLYALFEKRNGGKDTLTFVGIPSGSGGSGWGLTGNVVNSATDFIGSTNDAQLVFKVNNLTSGYIGNFTQSRNTSFGYFSLPYVTTSNQANTAFGYGSMRFANGGVRNSAYGYTSGYNITTASDNNVFGWGSFTYNKTGQRNVAVGSASMGNTFNSETFGDDNIAIGYRSLVNLYSSVKHNIAFGHSSGIGTTRSNTLFVSDSVKFMNFKLDSLTATPSYLVGMATDGEWKAYRNTSTVEITSYGKNATRDSTILLLSNGTRFAARDSVGTNTNFATSDLTATDNRSHFFNYKNLSISGINNLDLESRDISGTNSVSLTTDFANKQVYLRSSTPTIDNYVTVAPNGISMNQGANNTFYLTNGGVQLGNVTGIQINDTIGTFGQVLTSQGVGLPVRWTNASGGGVTITSYGKNAGRDSTILLLSDGTRFAARDSIGGGGSGSIDYTTEGYGIKVDSSGRVYTVRVDSTVIGSKTYVNNKVTQVVSDSTKEFTVGVGLELTNDTLLSLKQVTVDEIGGVSNEQTTIWDNSEPDLGVPSVNGYVLSSTTAGDRSWVAQSGGSTDTTSLSDRINTKQATLVSGTNIKTINGESLLGSSDIVISGGSGVDDNPSIKLLQGLGSLIKAQTFNALEATTATGLVDGTARFLPVYLAKGQTLTGVQYYQTVQGSYTADNNNQVALYTVNAATGVLTRVAVSNNDGTNIWKQAVNVTYKVPFSSTYVATAGVYYIGLLYNSSAQTTAPTILARTAGNNAAQAALDNTGSLTTSMTLGGQTALGTTYTASGLTTSATNPWVAIY